MTNSQNITLCSLVRKCFFLNDHRNSMIMEKNFFCLNGNRNSLNSNRYLNDTNSSCHRESDESGMRRDEMFNNPSQLIGVVGGRSIFSHISIENNSEHSRDRLKVSVLLASKSFVFALPMCCVRLLFRHKVTLQLIRMYRKAVGYKIVNLLKWF
jgi:hypothetical protein